MDGLFAARLRARPFRLVAGHAKLHMTLLFRLYMLICDLPHELQIRFEDFS